MKHQHNIADYRGQFDLDTVNIALDQTRILERNRQAVIDYFVHGAKLDTLRGSKQAHWRRLKTILSIILIDS